MNLIEIHTKASKILKLLEEETTEKPWNQVPHTQKNRTAEYQNSKVKIYEIYSVF